MLGSTKKGGEFKQHQTYRQSTSRSENSPKTNRWRHPVSGLQQPFFSRMNIEMWRPLSTSLSDFNAGWSQKARPRTVICAAESSGVDRGSLNRLSSSAKMFKRPGMWVMHGNTWYRRMNLKYGVNTAARTGVIVRPFAEAASAALLSVACWHAIGPRVRGRWASMQNDNANWARNSHAAICFCMSSPSPGHSICASSSDIRNWNQIWWTIWEDGCTTQTCHRGRGHSVRRCLDLNPCRSTHRQGKWRRNQELQPNLKCLRCFVIQFSLWWCGIKDPQPNTTGLDVQWFDICHSFHVGVGHRTQCNSWAKRLMFVGEWRAQLQVFIQLGDHGLESGMVHAHHCGGDAMQCLIQRYKQWSQVMPCRC